MLKPPFVILPIIAGAGLAIALLYWILSITMRPRQKPLKSVAVAHLASRPDYSAAFGAPPPAAAPPAPEPSAWADVMPATAAAAAAGSVEPAAEPPAPDSAEATSQAAAAEPPVANSAEATFQAAADEPPTPTPSTAPEPPPPDIAAAPDEPPDLPEPGDY